jgi:hypothetical protein
MTGDWRATIALEMRGKTAEFVADTPLLIRCYLRCYVADNPLLFCLPNGKNPRDFK